jgi:hypothetical protein
MKSVFLPLSKVDRTPLVQFNLVTHPKAILVKRYQLKEGLVTPLPGGTVPKGCLVSSYQMSLARYAQCLHAGGSSQYALPANTTLGLQVPLVTKQLSKQFGLGIHRGKEHMYFVKGQPAVLTLDYDPSAHALVPMSTPQHLWSLLVQCFPKVFSQAAHVGYYSSSSFIHYPDLSLYRGASGHHSAFAIADAGDIARFGEALFQRLWLRGLGYMHITQAGTLLARTLFDKKVLQPQQPLFIGGAHCEDGLTQRRPPPIIQAGTYIDSLQLPSLFPQELARYHKLIDDAKVKAEPLARCLREAYQQKEFRRLTESGIDPHLASTCVQARSGGTLIASDILHFALMGTVSVAEVLAHPEKYHGCCLHDPMEPHYGSAQTAIFYANSQQRNPIIFSHAHGGRKFNLVLA